MESDVIIIGAGALGLSLAYHLSKRNKRVVVLERDESYALNASGNNAGMFRQLYHHPQLTEWAKRSKQLWAKEIIENSFVETGSLIIGRHSPGHHQELFENRNIQLNEGSVPAVFTKTDGLFSPPKYARNIFANTDRNYVRFFFNTQCSSIEKLPICWHAKTMDGKEFFAPWIVNCTGAWVNDILKSRCRNLEVSTEAFARHLFVVDTWSKQSELRQNTGYCWEEETGWYVRDWGEDTELFSICDKTPAFPDTFRPDSSVNKRAEEMLSSICTDGGPDIKDSWYCFRTYTKDQMPIWGEDPEAPGLFWLAAFGGLGMSTSFAATYDACDYIVGKSVNISQDFLPGRARRIRQAA